MRIAAMAKYIQFVSSFAAVSVVRLTLSRSRRRARVWMESESLPRPIIFVARS